MNALAGLVMAGATARLTALVAQDEITAPVRERVIAWASAHPDGSLPERLGYLVDCRACASIWAALAVTGIWASGRGGRALVGVLALSQGTLMLSSVLDRLEEQGHP